MENKAKNAKKLVKEMSASYNSIDKPCKIWHTIICGEDRKPHFIED